MYYDLSNEALVELIIKDSCSEKFEHLFRRFYNLLWKFYGQIKIPSYEMDDYRQEGRIVPVSYTHLTLPTSDLV